MANHWWRRIKQRHLVRWVLAYVAAVWVIMQAIDILGGWYGIPVWLPRLLPVFVVGGLAITAILSWYHGQRGPQRFARTEVGLLILVLITTGAGVALVGSGGSVSANPPAIVGMAADDKPSLAILPFANLGTHPDWEMFGDGLVDELIGIMGRVEGLRVAGRSATSRYRSTDLDPAEIADRLRVQRLVEGSVRVGEDRLRVAARLIDPVSGHQLWSESYDRPLDEIFALQEEIARAIANALGIRLLDDSAQPVVIRYTENLDAYREYLRGRSLQERIFIGGEQTALQSIAAFEEALRIDPGYALAWSGIADTYAHYLADKYWRPSRAYPLASEAANRAIDLDPTLGEARASLGGVKFWNGWDPEGALEELDRAVALSPRYPRAHWIRGLVLHALSRYEDGMAAWARAAELDPSPYWSGWVTTLFPVIRPPAPVVELLADSLERAFKRGELGPEGLVDLRLVHYFAGDYERFLELFAMEDPDAPDMAVRRPSYTGITVAVSLARLGRAQEVETILAKWIDVASERYVAPYYIAAVAANLNPDDRAFEWLRTAVAERDANLAVWLDIDPAWDLIRHDPRFQAVRRRVGLAD